MRLQPTKSLELFEAPVQFKFTLEQPATKTFAETVNEASISIEAVVSPRLLEMIQRYGFTRRGSKRHVYSLSQEGQPVQSRFIREYIQFFQPYTLVDRGALLDDYLSRGRWVNRFRSFPQPAGRSHMSPYNLDVKLKNKAIYPHLTESQIEFILEGQKQLERTRSHTLIDIEEVANPYLVMLNVQNNGLLWLRIIENKRFFTRGGIAGMVDNSELYGLSAPYSGPISFFDYDKLRRGFEEGKVSAGHITADSIPFFETANTLETKNLVSYVLGEPNMTQVLFGSRSGHIKSGNSDMLLELAQIQEEIAADTNGVFISHPSLADLSSMNSSQPFDDPRLRDYQQEAVGLHLSTGVGYLNACAPGLGKTVMQLSAMRERSKTRENYRGLIISETATMEQWAEEATIWFPEAKVLAVNNNRNLNAVDEALSNEGPTVLLMAYSQLNHVWAEMERQRIVDETVNSFTNFADKMEYLNELEVPLTIGAQLINTIWNDIAADEAMVIRNNTSKQAKAAWRLRESAEVAVPLTGTPINNKIKDMANLVCWARNNLNLFRGIDFDSYDTSKQESVDGLFSLFGSMVFRRDTTVVQDELPSTGAPEVMLLAANPSERALIDTAENELRRCYEELLTALESVETHEGNNDEITALKEELADARKAWLGGQTLTRMATSDPHSLAQSESTGAILLAGQGLVDAALVEMPTKRKQLLTSLTERIANGEQVLVFVEFEATAKIIATTLKENGIKAEAYTGSTRRTRDAHRISFQNGDLDVLVMTQAGERGITLHKASAVYCYDMPWTLEKLTQRIGRAVRIGSENETVDIVFMVMKDTIEERIATKLVEMAVSTALLLDTREGQDINDTQMMQSFGTLTKAISGRTSNESLRSFGAEFLGLDVSDLIEEIEEEVEERELAMA